MYDDSGPALFFATLEAARPWPPIVEEAVEWKPVRYVLVACTVIGGIAVTLTVLKDAAAGLAEEVLNAGELPAMHPDDMDPAENRRVRRESEHPNTDPV
jgi:hypothetical protein